MSIPAEEKPRRAILVVDDDADSADLLSILLQAEGYTLVTAGTLAEARQRCQHTKFDLLIADIELPDGDGTDLLSQLDDCRPLKGIVVSGHEAEIRGVVPPGFSDYLVKPIQFDKLLTTVRRLIPQ